MKKIILILTSLLCISTAWGQRNHVKDFIFDQNTFVLNGGNITDEGKWYAELKGSSKGVFELTSDPFLSHKVFRADMSLVKDREEAYLAQNIEGLQKQVYKVGFWMKAMHRNAILRVEMQGFGTGNESGEKNKTILASTEVSKSLATFVPSNWIYYSFDMDLTNVDDSLLEDGKFIRFACYFNTYDNNGTPAYRNPGGDTWEFYVSGLEVKKSRSAYVLDGDFNNWTSSWPVASQSWSYTSDGDVCFERARGHLMDDFSIKSAVKNAGSATVITNKIPVNFPQGEFDFHFWARADQDHGIMTTSLPELGINEQSFNLERKWKMYTIRVNNTNKVKAGSLQFKYNSVGTFYLDEVSIEDITVQVDENNYQKYTVNSPQDDVEIEGTLRYFVGIAASGDTIEIDKSISAITLLSTLEINKSIVICGQNATIQVDKPGVSSYRLFNFGDNSNLEQTIKICDLNLLGGNIPAGYGAVGIIYKNTIFHADRVVFSEGKAQYSGGLHTDNALGTEVYLTDCSFINNQSTKNGGAFYAKGKAVLKNCLFEANMIASTGDGNGSAIATNADLQIINCVFRSNMAEGTGAYGAALFNTSNATARVEASLFENNSATHASKGTGAFGCSGNDTKTIFTNCTFSGNKGFQGGAIYNRAGNVYLINATLTGNISTGDNYGGAIDIYNVNTAKVYLVNSVIAYNYNKLAVDVSLGVNSILSGDSNLISAIKGSGNISLTNSILFIDDSSLFSSFETISHNGQMLTVPSLKEVDGTKVVSVGSASSLKEAGRSGVFEGYPVPVLDQTGAERKANPTVGASEYMPLTSIDDEDVLPLNYTISGNVLTLNLQKSSRINLIDMRGSIIYSKEMQEGVSFINLESLVNGIYVLQVVGDNLRGKFLKN